MKIRVIRNQDSHHAALRELEKLMDAKPARGTAKSDELELLALVIKAYEDAHFPAIPPDPIEAIKFRLEQEGRDPRELESVLGGPDAVRRVLSGKRPLTLRMIRALHQHLGIPAEVLISEPA